MSCKRDIIDLNEKETIRMCELCIDKLFCGQPVNTNQYNLCEGSNCELAFELILEELEEERKERVEYLSKTLKNIT